MFAIIYPGKPPQKRPRPYHAYGKPVCTFALLVPLFIVHRRAKNNGAFDTYKSPIRLLGARELAKMLFWQLDIVGVILIIAWLALILVPFTIAHGVQSQWKTAKVIAPLVVGVCCVPVWIFWERSCKHPMIPFRVRIRVLSYKCSYWLTLL